jgi:DNA polymerase-1
MACRGPNLQNVPRSKDYRRCFRPAQGRVLVKADYSQIELRLAAEIAGETRMLEAYQRGEDLHSLTAATVLGRADGQVRPEDRQAAKALNFGLLYGMGADGLRQYAANAYGVHLTAQEARSFRQRFFAAYPGLRRWHRSQREGEIETRTLAGRRRLGVSRFTEKLNSPVQGSGADGMKQALALLWETRDHFPGAVPVLVVHDELVVECELDQAEQVQAWVTECMVRGMGAFLTRVPVVVDANIVADWSGTDERSANGT